MPGLKSHIKGPATVIALLTDFGLEDQYVSVMKGVILSRNPNVKIVDISHSVQPFHIKQGSYLLDSSYKYFPRGTIFVCVVDPGVGSERDILGFRSPNYTFLAPNNGLLDIIMNKEKCIEKVRITELSAKKYIKQEVSATFHGRDIFAPIAAHLSCGVKLSKLGTIINASTETPTSMLVPLHSEGAHTAILHIDHFGNIITNISGVEYQEASKSIKAIAIGRNMVSRWINYYDEAPDNTPCLIVGSSGLIEICIKRGNAAQILNANLDTLLKVFWR